jgi:hypothetical protein
MSGLFKAGVNLDTLFMARVNAKRADVGIRSAGVDVSNRWETIGTGTPIAATNIRSAGTDLASLFRNISQPLTHTVSAPSQVSGYCSRVTVGSCTATTSAALATVTGGVGPFTYLWEFVSGDAATPVTPNSASTTFTRAATANFPVNVKQGFYRCKVTDTGNGNLIAYSGNVNVYTEHEYTG